MWDDELHAQIQGAWDDWQDKLSPEDVRFLENAAADVAMLARDDGVRARFRDCLRRFGAQYAAFRTAREAWDANPRTWRAEMGMPTNPLGAIWAYTYGTGWKGWQDLEPPGSGARAWSPLKREIEKEVPLILGSYTLLAVIHDTVLTGPIPINDGLLSDDLTRKIWCSLLNSVDGITVWAAPQYVIYKRHVDGASAHIRQDLNAERRRESTKKPEEKPNGPGQGGDLEAEKLTMEWDVFISHASEDKEAFVRPLAKALQRKGLRVWFDEFSLGVGDSLRRSIDSGLARSRYGVVVISPDFLKKEWPQKELDGLTAREVDGCKVVLPVWHNVDAETVRRHSPLLADRIAVCTDKGVDAVVEDLMKAMRC